MKIKNSYWLKQLHSKLLVFFQRPNLRLLAIFLVYNLVLAIVGLGIFFKKVPQQLREKVTDRVSVKKIPANYINGKTARFERLDIDIKHKHYQKLAYVRAMSMQRELLYDFEENKVPAVIKYNGQSYRVSLSLKGKLRSHWEDEEMMSFKVKVKDNKTIMGMKSFAIQHPGTRSYINEWVLHQLFSDAGIASLRYDFIAVNINGKGSRIYALEEGLEKRLIENNRLKEGPVFKLESSFRQAKRKLENTYTLGMPQDLWSAHISPIPKNTTLGDPASALLFKKAKSLMEAFRQNRLGVSEVFDIKKLATFFALVELFGSHHAASLDNIRFYYNPITSLIEPITHDNDHLDHLVYNGLLGAQRQLGNQVKFSSYGGWWKRTNWYEAIFRDTNFFTTYIQALEEISQPEYLHAFFERHQNQFEEKKKVLHWNYPLFKFDPAPILYENQAFIRKALAPESLINIHADETKLSDRQLRLSICNMHYLPVEILDLSMAPSLSVKLSGATPIIQAENPVAAPAFQTFSVELPKHLDWTEGMLKKLIVRCKILGSNNIIEVPVFTHPVSGAGPIYKHLGTKKTNINNVDFLFLDEQQKYLQLKEGKHKLDKDLIIPQGYRLFAGKGTQIDLTNNASIYSFSPIQFIGSKENPILIQSSDSTSSGLMVIDAEEESILQYVHFAGLASPVQVEWEINAAVTFLESPVQIDNCIFSHNQGGAQYLHLIRSEYQLNHTNFFGAKQNAFKGEFGEGVIKNTEIINSGKTAIYLSGSKTSLENISIDKCGEIGINASIKSTVEIRNMRIKAAEVAVASNDKSTISINGIDLQQCNIEFAAFQKGLGLGPASIEITNKSKNPGQAKAIYFVENKSIIKINGKKIKSNNVSTPLSYFLKKEIAL